MTRQIHIDQARERLPELITAAREGDDVVITTDEGPVARLIPVARQNRPRIGGGAKGMFEMSEDFDAPLSDFENYIR